MVRVRIEFNLSKVLYHTNWNLYHTDKNGFITPGAYHICFSKKGKKSSYHTKIKYQNDKCSKNKIKTSVW